ncbi:hypothetical protein [Streptomyces sp. NBC_01429]|uniref:hypothetical protein n=1 Tax=Streptomyces sp. NBC_01429 TaxID=2903862 RepID=UPI002E296B76|nr:hypothetical protein [Streptomyces sp. NBC_01429]
MYATQALTQVVPLAQDLDQNKVTPGVLGFIVFAVMAGGVWLLMKSMNRHMNMVNFEEPAQQSQPTAGTARTATPAEPATASEPRGE